jgi:hypothetical protein
MKKRLLLTILLFYSVSILYSNGAEAYSLPEIWQSGQIYKQNENNYISIEKELIVIKKNDFSYDFSVYYTYYNNSSEMQKLICAFPYEINAAESVLPDGFIKLLNENKISDNLSKIHFKDLDGFGLNYNHPSIACDRNANILSFKIFSNGHKIDINNVIIKRSSGKYRNEINFQFNFIYELTFEPESFHSLKVNYEQPGGWWCRNGIKETNEALNTSYILGTGRTWKDSIKTITVICENFYEHYERKTIYTERNYSYDTTAEWSLKLELPSAFTQLAKYNSKGYRFYQAVNYEPSAEDKIIVNYNYNYDNHDPYPNEPTPWELEEYEAQAELQKNGETAETTEITMPESPEKEYTAAYKKEPFTNHYLTVDFDIKIHKPKEKLTFNYGKLLLPEKLHKYFIHGNYGQFIKMINSPANVLEDYYFYSSWKPLHENHFIEFELTSPVDLISLNIKKGNEYSPVLIKDFKENKTYFLDYNVKETTSEWVTKIPERVNLFKFLNRDLFENKVHIDNEDEIIINRYLKPGKYGIKLKNNNPITTLRFGQFKIISEESLIKLYEKELIDTGFILDK